MPEDAPNIRLLEDTARVSVDDHSRSRLRRAIGFALGAEVDLLAYLTSRYFGLRYYGFLYALVYAFFWIGIALGPAITGHLFDVFGDYQIALRMIVILLLVGAAAACTLPRFKASFD